MVPIRPQHRGRWLLLAALCLPACAPGERANPAPDPASVRRTTAGEVVGFVGRYGGHVWLGIPYARPPVGALRWRAPEPPESWTGTRAALAPGSPCVQYPSPFGGVSGAKGSTVAGSEDCLFLNVYAPRFDPAGVPAAGDGLPVMVWIHGGGNTIGEAGFYNGGNLAVTRQVIVVALNYRLGPFGWFRHASLRNDDAREIDRSGNFGTLDMIRALAWVRENAAAFGGDPGNVTIFGESAGGVNVFSLLLSPEARGLFHRAVVQSGGTWSSSRAEAENFSDAPEPGRPQSSNEILLRLLIDDHRARDRAGAKAALAAMTAGDVARYLRDKQADAILLAYEPVAETGMIRMPQVFRDGAVLPDLDPLEAFSSAERHDPVPVILGTTRDENKLFLFADPERVRNVFWLFPRLRDRERYQLTAEYLSKAWKAAGADGPAAALAASQPGKVFVYRFDWDEEPTVLGADLSVMLGAAHGFEIPFVFGHFDLGRRGNVIFTEENRPAREELSRWMTSYWTEFAYAGSPGRGRAGELPEWKSWDAGGETGEFLVLDTDAGGGLRTSSDTVTTAGILAAVDEDPRLPTQRDRCAIFHDLAVWSHGMSREDYPSAGSRGCAGFPFDDFPW